MDEMSVSAPPRRWWCRPSVISLLVVVVVLAATLGWTLWQGLARTDAPVVPEQGLPWQVRVLPGGGSEVFGLALGRSTLADARQRFGDELHSGLMLAHGEAPALEGFVDGWRAGFVTGRLVLAFDADAGWLARALQRSPRNDVGQEGRSRTYALAADDVAQAGRARLAALAFVPSLALDEAMVRQRFGEPAERLPGPGGETQWLYPGQGLAIALPPASGEQAGARAVIQYVAPRDFEARLRAPLLAASRAASAAQPAASTSAPIAR